MEGRVSRTTLSVRLATPEDLPAIRSCYADGRATQRATRSPIWPEFTDSAILAEISAGHLLYVIDSDALVGVFSAVYNDEPIWGELERDAHIYLHRIARSATYQGRSLVDVALAWALMQCDTLGREGLRLDTWASNDVLIAYYQRRGFIQVSTRKIPMDSPMSEHYRGIELALLERPLIVST
jgi:ribosomal protein S18 acetylase RimI-like enzyme